MVVEHNQRSTWIRPLRKLRDATLGGHCGETMELEGRQPAINTPPHSPNIHTEFMKKSSSGWRSVGFV